MALFWPLWPFQGRTIERGGGGGGAWSFRPFRPDFGLFGLLRENNTNEGEGEGEEEGKSKSGGGGGKQ